ncbi:MAG TPA: lamin tail domain-containing protein [Polyangiaceae bacterium]|nr:lamin tail domain-containing protein [Polyangiaceae bacterium]
MSLPAERMDVPRTDRSERPPMNDSTSLRKTRRTRSLTVALAACGLLLVASCASGETVEQSLEPTAKGGSAGQAGASGASGASGAANKGGSAGTAGKAGQGGSAGAAGEAGQGGSAGEAGSGGVQGTGGASNPNCHLVINEIMVGSSSSASDEFVEIYNPCSSPVDLSGWNLVYRSATGSSDIKLVDLSSLAIGAQGYLVLAGSEFSGNADQTWTSGGLASAGGGVALRDSTDEAVDSIGYGSANNGLIEGGAAPEAPEYDSSLARTPNGNDTDNNASDFQVAASPTPGKAN